VVFSLHLRSHDGSVVLRAEISLSPLSYEDFRRVARGVRSEALQQQHPSRAGPLHLPVKIAFPDRL
jgi:hypothetical protein